MKWNKYSFKTTNDMVDILSALLSDEGIEGIEVEDHVKLSEAETKGMFIDILPDMGPDDGTARINFYLDPDDPDMGSKLSGAKAVLEQFGGNPEITEGETADVDWINNWKQFFHPLSVGNILIKPTWEDIPEADKDKLLIEIDPGTAFGTGGHETTQLCILQLEKYIEERNRQGIETELLDVGTGSGILGICGLKLGAKHCVGTDLDDNAIEAVGENSLANGISKENFEVICGNIIDDEAVQSAVGSEKYDIIVSNILAPVIIALVGSKDGWSISKHLKKGGIFITSGIIDTKEGDVVKAFKENPDFEILEIKHLGEWVSVTAKKN